MVTMRGWDCSMSDMRLQLARLWDSLCIICQSIAMSITRCSCETKLLDYGTTLNFQGKKLEQQLFSMVWAFVA